MIASVAKQKVSKNSPLPLDFFFTGRPNTSSYTYSINWGDPNGTGNVRVGTISATNGEGNGSFSNSHTYKHKGKYIVFVTVTDSDGVSDTIFFEVTVTN